MAVPSRIGASTGQLLARHPTLGAAHHRGAVVLITLEDTHGTLGLNLANPSLFSLSDVGASMGYVLPATPVSMGGPVGLGAITLLHTDEWYSTSTQQVCEGLAVTSDPLMLEKICMGNTPLDYSIHAGVCMWKPGELAQQLVEQQWITCDYTIQELFAGQMDYHGLIDRKVNAWVGEWF